MLSWARAHSSPTPFPGPKNSPSLPAAPPWPAPRDAHCCRMAHPLHRGFSDPATFSEPFGPGQSLGVIKLQEGLPGAGCEQGCIGLSLLLLTGGELAADSRPPQTSLGAVTIRGSPSPLCRRPPARSPFHALTHGFPTSSQVASHCGTAARRLRSKQAAMALLRPGLL